MGRIARVVAVGVPHHITQRGNYRQDIFCSDCDRNEYLADIKKFSHLYGAEILAYCLMNNHVHFIVIPHHETSLAKTVNNAHVKYSHYYNNKLGRRGHLWQDRYYSCVLDQKHMYCAVKYVERNPVRAGLVDKPWDWKWSSAAAHVGIANDTLGLADPSQFLEVNDWRSYLVEPEANEEIILLRKRTKTGRPVGDDKFLADLEKMLGRDLIPKKSGRPKNRCAVTQLS